MDRIARLEPASESDRMALCRLRGRLALRPREVARALGVALRTVESWIADGRLPACREGRIVLVRTSDLLGFLESRRLQGRRPEAQSIRERAMRVIEDQQRVRRKA